MKTFTVNEAAHDLAAVLKQAVAGEDIGIQSGGTVVALRPLIPFNGKTESEQMSPRQALRRLQQDDHLTPAQANAYETELRAERLASEGRAKA